MELTAAIENPVEGLQDFERVVQLHRPAVFRFILASVRDQDDAESLTQDCFLKAFRNRHQFRGDAAVKTWLFRIAVNLIRDLARSRRFQFWRHTRANAAQACDFADAVSSREASPEARTLIREQIEAIWTATAALPDRQRAVFLLRFVEDMNLLEIAAALDMSEGAVKKHLFRALHTVRERIRRL